MTTDCIADTCSYVQLACVTGSLFDRSAALIGSALRTMVAPTTVLAIRVEKGLVR